MPWNEALYPRLIDSAIVSLLVLAVGSGAVLLCRRPARRAWIIELTLAGCLVAPWLGTIPGYPRLGLGWRAATLPHQEESVLPASADRAEKTAGPSVVSPSDGLPVLPNIGTPDPVPRTADAPSHVFDYASWIVAAYAIGVALGLGWWLVGLLGLVKIMGMTRHAPSRCRELLAQIAGQGAGRVRLLISSRVRQPFAFAMGRPVIVLPEDLCGDDQAMRWSLAHEWTHIERHDFRAWLMAGLARVLFFYHPLVWWLRRQLRLYQDFLADDRAARQTAQPEDYAEFLTASAAGSLRPALAGLGMGCCKSELYRRVVMLVQNRPMESRVPRLWTVSVACAALVLVSVAAALSIAPQAAAQGGLTGKSEGRAPGMDAALANPMESSRNNVVGQDGESEDNSMTAPAEQSLQEAVKTLNEAASDNGIGRSQPPLTEDEVIAAIRGWDRDRDKVDDNTYAIFQKIVKTKMLPKRAKLRFTTDWEASQGYSFKVWCIDLDVWTSETTGYTFRIRDRKINSSPARTLAIHGKVIDEGGKPVAGAEVWLPLLIRGAGHVHTSHARSDAQGRFLLKVAADWLDKVQPWDRAMTVWAYAAGHQLGTGKVTLPAGASDVGIRLGPVTDTSFVVLDPEGRPFAGALVEPFYVKTWQGIEFPPDELLARIGARTDAEGQAKLPAIPPDLLYQVRVTTEHFGTQFQRTVPAPAIVDQAIHLRPVGRIEGRILAGNPQVIRGVRLIFTSEGTSNPPRPSPTKAWPTEGYADVESDEHGQFVVPAIAAGRARIDVHVDENQPLRPKLPGSGYIEINAGNTTSFEIPIVPTVVARGSVRVKDTGKPVPGTLISIYYGVGRQAAEPVSDEQGNYTARVLPGTIRLQVIAMPIGYAWLHGDAYPFPSYQVPEDAKRFDLPPVEVEPTKSISGRVVDQQGQPVGDIWISVVDGDRHYGRGKSDKNGHFDVTGVPVTINPANVKYAWLPAVGPGRPFVSTMPSECEILKTDPLILRALPRDPREDQP